jgi:excisionase family DNA binding protein
MNGLAETAPAQAWLTFREAADFLRVSSKTLQRYVEEKRVPKPSRVGRKLLWDRAKLHAHVQGLEA